MAVLMTARMAGMTPEVYDALNAQMNFPAEAPDGLISHVAAPVDGDMQIVDVWESEEKFFAFFENTLGPAAAAVEGAGELQPSGQRSLEIHNRWSA